MFSNKTLPKAYVSLHEALEKSTWERKNDYREFINPHLASLLSLIGFDKTFVKAEGIRVWDAEGNSYLDFLGGYGALNLGHNPRKVFEGIAKVQHMPNILQASINGITAALGRSLAMITPGNLHYTFFSNSGAEAVECSLKMARAATGRSKIIYCENSFHGKTMGALSITGREKYRTLFQPLLYDVVAVPFNNLNKLEEALMVGDAAAFIMEPIQGEGGIHVPYDGYLRDVRRVCTQYRTLLIFDEVQTGFGRTGKMFACEHEEVEPDIMCMAKSLGGGVIPVGATIATKEVWKRAFGTMERCLLHTSTFGGNTLAAAAGLVTIEEIMEQDLVRETLVKGEYFICRLRELQGRHPIIKEIRGKGLMIGLEFHDHSKNLKKISDEYLGALIAGELLKKHHIITAYTLNNPNVIRMEPPLIVAKSEIDTVLDSLECILNQHKSFLSFVFGNTKNIIHSMLNR